MSLSCWAAKCGIPWRPSLLCKTWILPLACMQSPQWPGKAPCDQPATPAACMQRAPLATLPATCRGSAMGAHMVSMRCAMTSNVRRGRPTPPAMAARSARWMVASVARSTLAVASSSARTAASASSALRRRAPCSVGGRHLRVACIHDRSLFGACLANRAQKCRGLGMSPSMASMARSAHIPQHACLLSSCAYSERCNAPLSVHNSPAAPQQPLPAAPPQCHCAPCLSISGPQARTIPTLSLTL